VTPFFYFVRKTFSFNLSTEKHLQISQSFVEVKMILNLIYILNILVLARIDLQFYHNNVTSKTKFVFTLLKLHNLLILPNLDLAFIIIIFFEN